MEARITERLIELASKWQQRFSWEYAYEQADDYRGYRDKTKPFPYIRLGSYKQADDFREHREYLDRAMTKQRPETDQHSPISDLFHAGLYEGQAELSHQFVTAAHHELFEMKDLVRRHAPTLLELVPSVNFLFDPKPADLSNIFRDMRKLEGDMRTIGRDEPLEVTMGQMSKLTANGVSVKTLQNVLSKERDNGAPQSVRENGSTKLYLYIELRPWVLANHSRVQILPEEKQAREELLRLV